MNTLKTIAKILVFIIVASLISKGIAYTIAENKVKNNSTYQEPTSFKEQIVQGCLGVGGEANRSYCNCTADYMQNTLGDARLQAVALEYTKSGQTQPEMTAAINACIDKYVTPPTTQQD